MHLDGIVFRELKRSADPETIALHFAGVPSFHNAVKESLTSFANLRTLAPIATAARVQCEFTDRNNFRYSRLDWPVRIHMRVPNLEDWVDVTMHCLADVPHADRAISTASIYDVLVVRVPANDFLATVVAKQNGCRLPGFSTDNKRRSSSTSET